MGNLLFYCTWAYLFYPLNTVKDEEADRVWRRPCTNIHRALKNWKGSWRWSWWGFTVILKILSLVDNQSILRIQIKKKKKSIVFLYTFWTLKWQNIKQNINNKTTKQKQQQNKKHLLNDLKNICPENTILLPITNHLFIEINIFFKKDCIVALFWISF